VERLYAGAGRAGRTLVLDGDVTATPITHAPAEMAFLEGSRAGREEILGAFGVPPAVAGLVQDVNRASIDGVTYAFLRFTVKPKLDLVAEAVNRHVLPRFDPDIWCEFDLDVPRDRDAVRADWEMGLRHGAVTVNEYRTLELGLAPVPWGDRPWLPASRVQVGRADARGRERAARLARLAARLAARTLGPSGSEERNEG
jgi:phage portal protein BeeE